MGKRNNTIKNKHILKYKDMQKMAPVEEIISLLASGVSKKEIANKCKISITDVVRIKRAHLKEIDECKRALINKSIDLIGSTAIPVNVNITPKVKEVKKPEVKKQEIIEIKVEPIEEISEIKIEKEEQQLTIKDAIPEPVVIADNNVALLNKEAHVPATRNKIPDSDIAEIKRLLNNNTKVSDIVSMYGISKSTVYKIKNDEGRYKLINVSPENSTVLISGNMKQIRPSKKEADNSIKPNVVNIDDLHCISSKDDERKIELSKMKEMIDNLNLKRIEVVKYLDIGMIDGRHDLPTNEFIFDSVPKYLISNYSKLYQISYDKLDNLFRNHLEARGLNLYVTGLAQVLGAIIKACNELKINLTLYHYNPTNNTYEPQEIFENFSSNNVLQSKYFNNLKYDTLYTYNCNTKDFTTFESLTLKYRTAYEMIEILYNDDDTTHKSIVLFSTYNDAKYYFDAVKRYHQLDNTKVKLILNDINLIKDTESISVSQTLFEYSNR